MRMLTNFFFKASFAPLILLQLYIFEKVSHLTTTFFLVIASKTVLSHIIQFYNAATPTFGYAT